MPTWDELYAQGLRPAEPLPWLVTAAERMRSSGVRRVLDLGCGTGRHLVHLGRLGFQLWGTDIAPHGVAHSRAWLEQEGLAARLALADMRAVPFESASFDAVVSTHVLYHATRAGVQIAIDEIRRVLRPGGLFVGTFLSTRTWKYGEGQLLEEDTYVQARGPEAGVPHHYCDAATAMALLTRFWLLDVHLDEFLDEAGDRQSHWEVLAQRD
jgi:tellurite methyltransferase